MRKKQKQEHLLNNKSATTFCTLVITILLPQCLVHNVCMTPRPAKRVSEKIRH